MGWKCLLLIVSNVREYDEQNILEALNLKNVQKKGEDLLETAIYPRDNSIGIGQYKGHLLLCGLFVMDCLNTTMGAIEHNLIKLFPQSELCALSLHSVVNHWGYSLIQNGAKVRARIGDAEHGTFVDVGQPLPEELALLQQSTIDETGERLYVLDEFPDDPMTEDQVGEEFVFELSKKYFGERLDQAEDWFEVPLSKFSTCSV